LPTVRRTAWAIRVGSVTRSAASDSSSASTLRAAEDVHEADVGAGGRGDHPALAGATGLALPYITVCVRASLAGG
jgi:hypothetical protein